MSFTTFSAGTFVVTGFFIIFNSIWGKDEPQILRYAITPNRSMGADVRQLPCFFSEPRGPAGIMNFDADLYTSTLCALTNARSVIDAGTVLIFDEFIVNSDWEQDEYRALNEFCEKHGVTYEVLAVSLFTKQMVCKIHV
jgi:hypothetical protein